MAESSSPHTSLSETNAADEPQSVSNWRRRLRTPLVTWQDRELPYLVSLQKRYRAPSLDAYFVNSSLLGSHTFFVLFIPLFFWFGLGDLGRGLFYTLAGGGYWISILKDIFCVQRPAAPPLVRLSTGNHDQMYGFPSAHSNTAISMATFFAIELYKQDAIPLVSRLLLYSTLLLFAGSITFGRIYTGMHSFLDVAIGSAIGFASAILYRLLRGNIDTFTAYNPLYTTGLLTPMTILLALYHPLPLEACPCFDEAISFISVASGMLVGRSWSLAGYSLFINPSTNLLGTSVRTTAENATARVLLGTLIIFIWRTLGKKAADIVFIPAACCLIDYGDDPITPSSTARQAQMRVNAQAVARVGLYAGLGYLASVGIPDLFVSMQLLGPIAKDAM